KVSEDDLAAVVIKNRANALFNENGCYGATLSNEDIANSSVVASPIRVLDIAHYADTAMCLILAEESFIKEKKIKSQPVWVNGFGFCNGSNTLESREWVQPKEASLASQKALKMAGLKNKDIDFVEISDTYSYKELQLLETAGFCKFGSAKSDLKKGKFDIGGALPVNASGGELGNGTLLEATGLFKVTELVKQLRGHAGRRQLPKKVSNGFALGWRDIPTTSYAAIVMGNKK
ncbi:MAG: hypothetical protein HY606_02820, partial [Planctomycetes bacterium]|nr:hypothetical protein [Planctomycetota bacterium]